MDSYTLPLVHTFYSYFAMLQRENKIKYKDVLSLISLFIDVKVCSMYLLIFYKPMYMSVAHTHLRMYEHIRVSVTFSFSLPVAHVATVYLYITNTKSNHLPITELVVIISISSGVRGVKHYPMK